MVNQTSIQFIDLNGYKNVLHFRHDGIYMALSREKAAMYAVRNTYGSEILGRCIILFELLTANGVNATLPEEAIGQFDFRAFVGVKRKPIMIQAIGIEDVKLEKEDGKTAKEALDFLRRELPNFNARERFEFIQYCNFKLLSPVPPKKLNYYEIEFEGEPGKPNFEFTLNRI